jgi:hypothetical protein
MALRRKGLLGRMQDLVASAQADPVVAAQQQFLALLAQVCDSPVQRRRVCNLLQLASIGACALGTSQKRQHHCRHAFTVTLVKLA